MSEKLIPCPICGSENTVRLPYNDRADIERCKNCNLTIIVPFGYTMWNTRPIEDELRKRIAELEAENIQLGVKYQTMRIELSEMAIKAKRALKSAELVPLSTPPEVQE